MTDFGPISADRQIRFRQRLIEARSLWLLDALQSAAALVDPGLVREQVGQTAPILPLQSLAKSGIRDEHVFAVPAILEHTPTLLGYYRLLLGVPQKTFYSSATRLQMFKSMETKGSLNDRQSERLWDLCRFLNGPLADLVLNVSPYLSLRDIQELPLLTLGSQFQGANNNIIGQAATTGVFNSINTILHPFLRTTTHDRSEIVNSAGRTVVVRLASDPDVSVTEIVGSTERKTSAIEIKGGLDQSNAHNRAGEAEKSHQKARAAGYLEFWTLISKGQLDMNQFRRESPTTSSWFDVTHVLAHEGDDWEAFRAAVVQAVGIPLEEDVAIPTGNPRVTE